MAQALRSEVPSILRAMAFNADGAVDHAAQAASRIDIHEVERKKPERALVEAFERGLAQEPRCCGFVFEQPTRLKNWTSPPGGIDLVADIGIPQTLYFEMKVDKPDETIWDAIKLADLQAVGKCHGIYGAYLVTWATEASWKRKDGSPLFDSTRNWGVEEMISEWPKAWNKLREGGNGKFPRHTVAEIGFEPVGEARRAVSSRYEASIKVARVWPASLKPQKFDSEGWPLGIKVPNFATPMSKIVAGKASQPVGTPDPCHGYLFLDRWNQARLETLVPLLDADSRSCLRSRLKAERKWTEEELVDRFDPIPGIPGRG